ncbi:DUF1857-domain-containing protein [Tothia fuscella]|uniref:DUF1857-domain-containing protein n=1 Tax=Tothia fuscella TaxID=1048955 RepID=A0A9P4NJ32_9PEZI|nr:DUF1857-domain-containing protein [Tothia fuscella]
MAPLNLTNAYTAPINPAGATPILKRETVFAGLKLKVRDATAFVPVIIHCEVVKEEGDVVTREIRFAEGKGPPGLVKEVCVECEPTKVDFKQPDGSTISNIISDGPIGDPTDLYLSYSFEWIHEGVEAGSEEAKKLQEDHRKTAKMAVDKTIETIRKLVNDGKI